MHTKTVKVNLCSYHHNAILQKKRFLCYKKTRIGTLHYKVVTFKYFVCSLEECNLSLEIPGIRRRGYVPKTCKIFCKIYYCQVKNNLKLFQKLWNRGIECIRIILQLEIELLFLSCNCFKANTKSYVRNARRKKATMARGRILLWLSDNIHYGRRTMYHKLLLLEHSSWLYTGINFNKAYL